MALIEDVGLDAGVPASDRFVFLASSVRPLPAPAIAYDLVDRGGSRSELVVLTRAASGESRLSFFNLQGVDPAAPSDFATSRPEIVLNGLVAETDFCPIDIGASSGGDFIAIVSDPSACGPAGTVAVYILTVDGAVPQTVGATVPLPGGTFVNQDNDRLYFANQEAGGAVIYFVPMNAADAEPEPITTQGIDFDELRDMGPVAPGAGENDADAELVVLLDDGFVPILDYLTAPTLGEKATEVVGGEKLLLDDVLFAPNVMVLDSSFWIFESVADDEPGRTSLPVEDGAVDAERGFVYFVDDGRLCLFDLLTYSPDPDDDQDPDVSCGFPIPELVDPAFITWARAALDTPAP